MECAADSDVVILASGDGDFDILVRRIRDKHGVEVEVYGVEALSAKSLVTAATLFYPIEHSLLL